MAPRSIWNGTIGFGMVRVPIKLYSATVSHTIRFREVHLKDGSPLEHRRICTKEDSEVPYDEIVKGYEVADGEYVILEPDEIKAAAGDRGKLIEIEQFTDVDEIDPVRIGRSYFAGTRDEPETWALLHRALTESEMAGIGRFTFHNREYLVAVRALGPVIAVHVLKFADEIIHGDELDVADPPEKLTAKERRMAEKLIDGLYEEFDPAAWEDQHRDAVMELIRDKAEGRKAPRRKAKSKRATPDLAAALEASLEQTHA